MESPKMQRKETLKGNDISAQEKIQIENISRRIIRFKGMLNQQWQEQLTQ